MTVYFKEPDWQLIKGKLYQLQKLTGENSELGALVDDCLEILENQDRDATAEDIQQEEAIAKKNPSKTGGERGSYWIA